MRADTLSDEQQWHDDYRAASHDLMDVPKVLEADARVRSGQRGPARVHVLARGSHIQQASRVGVFAGSFNPLTIAHAAVAEAADAALGLDTLLWAFARVTVDKERVTRASLGDRVVQLEAHLRRRAADGLLLMDAGLYADQAEALRTIIGAETELWLIVGYDKIVQIFDPRYYDDRELALRRLFSAAALLVVPRDEGSEADLKALLDVPANRPYAVGVRYLPLPPGLAHVSSTAARARARAGDARTPEDWRGLLAAAGAALTLVTGAYEEPRRLSTGETVDRYGLRLAWIEALQALPESALSSINFTRLMEVTCAESAAGEAVRRWLRGERQPDDPEDVAALIARYV